LGKFEPADQDDERYKALGKALPVIVLLDTDVLIDVALNPSR
jgi:hypothetical protein